MKFSCFGISAPLKSRNTGLICAAALALVLCSAGGVSADEVRAWWIEGWGAGFWNQSQVETLLGVAGNGSSKGDIRNANCNTVILEIRRRADAAYPSIMGEPYMTGLSPSDFNALQAVIDAAHDTTGGKQRVDVIPWLVTAPCGSGTVYSQHNNPSDPDNYWLTRDSTGATYVPECAFDPGHPKAEEYLSNVFLDVACNFDVDGIQFDYIRYLQTDIGYNPTSISRFNTRYGRTGQPLSTDDLFEQWRRDQVTALVRRVYAKAIAVKPNIKVSAAVVTWWPASSESTHPAFQGTRPYYQVYQDWDSWLQEGILDQAVLMNYFDQGGSYSSGFTKWMDFAKDRKAGRHVIIGPGCYMNSLSNSILQLQMTRNPSTAGNYGQGFSGYHYRVPYSGGNWASFSPSLVSGVTPTTDTIPSMPWKSSPTKGHIMGTVIYYSGAAWADGATVTISGRASRTMTCDGTGFYAFIDLPPGSYTVTASKTGYSDLSAPVTVTAGTMILRNFAMGSTDVTNPTTPTNLTATATSQVSVSLGWTASTDNVSVSGYNIYRGGFKIASTASTSYIDTTVQPNTSYTYRVAAYDPSGNESPMCSAANVTTPATPPTTEIIIDDLDAQTSYTGSWTPSTSPGGWPTVASEYKWASTATSTNATFTWRPNLSAGSYDIYVYYLAGSNRSAAAPFTITYGSGNTTVNVNQTTGGTWSKVASSLPFSSGTAGYVTLANGTSESSKVVVADAVKFVTMGGTGRQLRPMARRLPAAR